MMTWVCLLLVVGAPIAEPTELGESEALLAILEGLRRSYDQQCSSFEVPYEITIARLTPGQAATRPEDMARYGGRLTFMQGKWAEHIEGVRFSGAGGESHDNVVDRTYDLAARRTQFTENLEGDKTGRVGYINADDTLYSSVNYLSFFNRYGSEHVADYLVAHRADARVVEVSDSRLSVEVRPEKASSSRVIITFCPTKDFSVEQIETYDEMGNHFVKTVAFRRTTAGLWLPERGTIATYVPDGTGRQLVNEISLSVPDFNDLKIGEDYPDSRFTLEFAPGTRVTDFTAGEVTYTVGEASDDLLDALQLTCAEFAEDIEAENVVGASGQHDAGLSRATSSRQGQYPAPDGTGRAPAYSMPSGLHRTILIFGVIGITTLGAGAGVAARRWLPHSRRRGGSEQEQ